MAENLIYTGILMIFATILLAGGVSYIGDLLVGRWYWLWIFPILSGVSVFVLFGLAIWSS